MSRSFVVKFNKIGMIYGWGDLLSESLEQIGH